MCHCLLPLFHKLMEWNVLTWFEIMHIKAMESLWDQLELNGNTMRQVWKTHHFYKECRHIFQSHMPRGSARVKNASNRTRIYTSVYRPYLCGRRICNMIIPSKQTLELSNDFTDTCMSHHQSEDDNYEHPTTVATAITPVWVINIIV